MAPEGQLRYEARLRAKQLRSAGALAHGGHVRIVADVQEEKCRELRRWMFDRVQFGREVVAVGRVQEMVFQDVDPVTKRDPNGMTKAQQRALWAYLTAGARGVDIGMSRNTQARYKRLASQVGVTLAATAAEFLDETRMTLHLDYEQGTEVLVAA